MKIEYSFEPKEDLLKYCFSAAYILKLLSSSGGIGFSNSEENIKIIQSIRNVDLDWALGAAIYEVSRGFENDLLPNIAHSQIYFYLFGIIIIFFCFIVGFFIFRNGKYNFHHNFTYISKDFD